MVLKKEICNQLLYHTNIMKILGDPNAFLKIFLNNLEDLQDIFLNKFLSLYLYRVRLNFKILNQAHSVYLEDQMVVPRNQPLILQNLPVVCQKAGTKVLYYLVSREYLLSLINFQQHKELINN